jgi:hypothetical protein
MDAKTFVIDLSLAESPEGSRFAVLCEGYKLIEIYDTNPLLAIDLGVQAFHTMLLKRLSEDREKKRKDTSHGG